MAEHVDLRDPLERRLESLVQAIEVLKAMISDLDAAVVDVEATLVVLVEQTRAARQLTNTDHYGVGRRGVEEER